MKSTSLNKTLMLFFACLFLFSCSTKKQLSAATAPDRFCPFHAQTPSCPPIEHIDKNKVWIGKAYFFSNSTPIDLDSYINILDHVYQNKKEIFDAFSDDEMHLRNYENILCYLDKNNQKCMFQSSDGGVTFYFDPSDDLSIDITIY